MPCINCKQLKKKKKEKYIVLTYILLTCCTRRRGGGQKVGDGIREEGWFARPSG